MAAGRPKSIDDNKIFDVSKPGKSKPMGTSRPVIMSRGNIIKDPNDVSAPIGPPSATRKVIRPVTEKEDAAKDSVVQVKVGGGSEPLEESMTESTAPQKAEIEVKNTAPTVEPDKAEETPVADQAEPVAQESTAGESAPEETPAEPVKEAGEVTASDSESPAETTAETTSEEEVPATSETAAVDALAESTTKNKESEKELEEQAKRDAELQALIDSKKYFVPLEHDSSAKKSNTGIWVLIIIILLAAGVYVAIDMKLIRTGIKLPFHLFKQ